MRALPRVPADVRALLTDTHSVDALRPFAEAEGYAVFRGPDEDVLSRYCLACRAFGVSTVIRATGDNPLTSAALAGEILAAACRAQGGPQPLPGLPWGMGVEVVEASALFAAERDAQAADEREHITTFLYRNREKFTILRARGALPRVPAGGGRDGRHAGRLRAGGVIFETLYRESRSKPNRWWPGSATLAQAENG